MKCQRVGTFGSPRPRVSLTGEADLLESETRLIADHGACAALALQAVAHRDARWFTLNRKLKLPAAAGGVSGGHGSAPWLSLSAECRVDLETMHRGQWIAPRFPKRRSKFLRSKTETLYA
jgi:hypothetical protein